VDGVAVEVDELDGAVPLVDFDGGVLVLVVAL
jgi:hypothetical protein